LFSINDVLKPNFKANWHYTMNVFFLFSGWSETESLGALASGSIVAGWDGTEINMEQFSNDK
jgi:hypothetical protein